MGRRGSVPMGTRRMRTEDLPLRCVALCRLRGYAKHRQLAYQRQAGAHADSALSANIHAILKCYVLIDLKARKLTHQDLGQIQLYVNYYDRERRTPGDNPSLGLVLCTEKNETVVKCTTSGSANGSP